MDGLGKAEEVLDQRRAWNAELERRVAERTAELEKENQMKDDFLAMVSHELRTPLNAMAGWIWLLRAGTLDDAQRLHALETIESNKNTLAQLIDDLMDVSRITSGRLRVDLQPIELGPVIGAAADTLRPAMEAKELQLRTEIEPKANPVLGDATRLQQVVWNLLANALKFTPRGGSIEVVVRCRESDDGSIVEITVSDTGKGIEPELLPYIFEPFKQGEQTSARRQRGLGLGLAIVKDLVELHGGTVEAHSRGKDAGASFTVRLRGLAAAC